MTMNRPYVFHFAALCRSRSFRVMVATVVALGILLPGLASSPALAQRQERSADVQRKGKERPANPQRSRTLVVLRIADALDLDEDQTLRLGSEYRRFDKRRQELIGDRLVTEAQLERALEQNPLEDAQLASLTSKLLAIDKELVLMPDSLFDSVEGMLTTEQKARFALLKIKLQRKIDRERNRRKGKGAPGPRGGKKARPGGD